MLVELEIHRAMTRSGHEEDWDELKFMQFNAEPGAAIVQKADQRSPIWGFVRDAFEFIEYCG